MFCSLFVSSETLHRCSATAGRRGRSCLSSRGLRESDADRPHRAARTGFKSWQTGYQHHPQTSAADFGLSAIAWQMRRHSKPTGMPTRTPTCFWRFSRFIASFRIDGRSWELVLTFGWCYRNTSWRDECEALIAERVFVVPEITCYQ